MLANSFDLKLDSLAHEGIWGLSSIFGMLFTDSIFDSAPWRTNHQAECVASEETPSISPLDMTTHPQKTDRSPAHVLTTDPRAYINH